MASVNNPGALDPVELEIETSAATKSYGAQAEAQSLLKILLGIDAGNIEIQDARKRDALTRIIAQRICSAVSTTRASMTETRLKELLDERIDRSLAILTPATVSGIEQRASIIADAIYKSVPPDLIRAFTEQRLTPLLSETGAEGHILEKEITFSPLTPVPPNRLNGNYVVRVDLTHAFWRGKKVKDADELHAELLKVKRVGDLGIRMQKVGGLTVQDTHELDDAEIKAITGTNTTAVNWDVVGRGKRYGVATREAADPFDWRVDVDALSAERTTADAPGPVTPGRELKLRCIGACTQAEFEAILTHAGGGYRYWKELAPSVSVQMPNPNTAHPSGGTWAAYIARKVFERASRAPTDTLAGEQLQLHEIQERSREQHELIEKLQKGSENYMGAALAAVMVIQDMSLRPATADANAIEDEVKKLENRKKIHTQLDKFREVSVELTSVTMSFSDLEKELKNLVDDLKKIGKPGMTDWDSEFGKDRYAAHPPKNVKSIQDVAAVSKALKDRQSETKEELELYKTVEKNLLRLAQAVKAGGYQVSDSTTLSDYVVDTAGVLSVKKTEIKPDFNFSSIADAIASQLSSLPINALPALDEIEKQFSTKKEELEKAKQGGPEGNELQHAVFAAYLKKTNASLNDIEAKKGANYLQARTYLDQELTGAIQEVNEHLFGDEPESQGYWWNHDNRGLKILGEVAKAAGVKVSRREVSRADLHSWITPQDEYMFKHEMRSIDVPDWSSASPSSLITAYFTLKQLVDGKGPSNLNLSMKPKFIMRQLNQIANLLATTHVHALHQQLYPYLEGDKKKKVDEKGKKLTTKEVIEMYLSGEPPEKFKGSISKILEKTDKGIYWKRHRAKAIWEKPKYGLRALLYDNDNISARGLLRTTIAKPAGWTWKNKGNIAAITAFSILGGPLLGVGAWWLMKQYNASRGLAPAHT